jgi:hypothetical protein
MNKTCTYGSYLLLLSLHFQTAYKFELFCTKKLRENGYCVMTKSLPIFINAYFYIKNVEVCHKNIYSIAVTYVSGYHQLSLKRSITVLENTLKNL